MYTFDGKAYDCPFDCFIDIIKGKWRTSIYWPWQMDRCSSPICSGACRASVPKC